MNCDFFSMLDFDALYRREIQPSFTPEVVNEFDTKYVPKVYLQAEGGEKNENFEAFTFADGRAIDR
jgi:hypothetical protein